MDNPTPDSLKTLAESPFVAGLLAGIVALRGVPGSTWPERVFNVFCAAITAGFVSPAINEWFGLTSPAMQSATAFLVGLFGMNIVATLVVWIRNAKPEDWLPWANRKGD